MFHIICIFIVLLLRTNPHPEKVLWLLPLINYLGENFIHQFGIINFPLGSEKSLQCYI